MANLTADDSKLMAALGRELDKAVPKGRTKEGEPHAEGHVERVLQQRRFAALRRRTKQWYRRLRVAARVCGSNLEHYLRTYGPTAVLLVSKLEKAPSILHAGIVITTTGEKRSLTTGTKDKAGRPIPKVTTREIEDLLFVDAHRPRLDKPRKPVGVRPFRVREDLLAVSRTLFLTLKTLRPRPRARPVPRYVPGVLSAAERRRLRRLLQVYGRLLKLIGTGDAMTATGSDSKPVPIRDPELVAMLRKVAKMKRPQIVRSRTASST